MHIAISTTPLEEGHQDRGVGQYTKLLIDGLQRYEKSHSYSFFTRGQKVPENADLVHYPYFDPFFLTLPLIKSKPTVVTVHDLIPIRYAAHFPRGIRGEIKWQIQKLALGAATRIIADSQASKRDIHSLTGYSDKRIDVVHLAPSSIFQSITEKSRLEHTRRKYNLPEHFILYVGDVNWNKNVEGLVRAFSFVRKTILVKGLSLKPKLVLVGKAFLNNSLKETQHVNTLIHSLRLSEEIIKLGFVPEEDLVGIYNLANAYIQPSFAEGFGLPVLEAMACGCPVVVAKGTSLDEIAGPSLGVDPQNPTSIAEGIRSVLGLTQTQRKTLTEDGYTWVKQFSWQRVVKGTIASYEKALGRI